ncbi:LemA family protein [Phenylobacterium hankyongense]|uniref:LemA family protein n=1 Tax=Phenylobacterium hankyongense TaxID=1813876 RepID=A0A328AXK8_9CAUL|nr:LemA family protein [Phenylobacterium hankyongense]RAK59005.1 LemA family protein [Phenylobacterium hankyongense]
MTTFRTRFARAALIVLAPLLVAACGVNTIPTKEERAKAQWAEVQNQYQRRNDLIPNLVSTVKGYAAQEKSVLIGVSQARAGAMAVRSDAGVTTDPAAFQRYQQAQNNVSMALAPFRVLQENYPDLKSNTNFMALQSQLEGTENRIAISRRDYNEAVRDFNTTLRTFPTILWAKTMYSASKPMQLFAATAASQSAPSVSFDQPAAPSAAALPPGQAPAPAPAQ